MAADGKQRRVVLGLGNPGARYSGTRHNVGFRVVEEIARRRGVELVAGECNTVLGVAVSEEQELILGQPQTFMNRSGYAACCLKESHGLEPKDFLVVYDEIHLPLGALRLRHRGSPGGHRGMESVLESLGTSEVSRLRLGVAAPVDSNSGEPSPGKDLVDFVLADFANEEADRVQEMIQRAAEACEIWALEGTEAAMQRFNRASAPSGLGSKRD
jgi:PTH1 family peptidyl-tRNA hydrolase